MVEILITNDDGIHSAGIKSLAASLRNLGKVTIVSPDREMSSISHAISLHRPLRMEKIEDNSYKVNGTPADCIYLGSIKIIKQKPDLVVSGINKGPNIGEDVIYSGTVAGALEATILGIPSFSISLASYKEFNFKHAACFAQFLAEKILAQGLPKSTFLNINVPLGKIKEIKITTLGRRYYVEKVEEKIDPRGDKYYWIGGEASPPTKQPGTDVDAIAEGYVSVTPLQLDFTNYNALECINDWSTWLCQKIKEEGS
jgi:5'-nucleotidase